MSKSIRYINRDISWLQFNERVLQEANDPTVPLLERIKFLGIFSNNQDEFFRTRVGSLRSCSDIQEEYAELGYDPQTTLKQVGIFADKLREEFENIFKDLTVQLRENNIYIVNEKQLNDSQKKYTLSYFRDHVRAHLFPLLLDKFKDHRSLNEHSIYLFVRLSSSKKAKNAFSYAILEIPSNKISRFLVLPNQKEKHFVIILDDVIRLGFSDIFKPFGYDIFEAYTFKITRNADVSIDTSRETVEVIKELVKRRRNADVIRFLYDREMPKPMLDHLLKALKLRKQDMDIDAGSRYHNSKDFSDFPTDWGKKDLIYKPYQASTLNSIPIHANMLTLIKKQDYLLHFPYQSFQLMIDFLREVSIDPYVTSIKMTVYRVAEDSSILNALVNAARNGKDVSVYVEVKARFDEINNLNWVQRLKNEGVKVMNLIPEYKVHAKMVLVTAKPKGKKERFAAIGTGNPNEETARIYTDKLLLTANPKITDEVSTLFKMIENRLSFPMFDTLLVAPINLRERVNKLIDFEIEQAKQGKKAWIRLKLNALSDKQIIDKLYEAASHGVKIDMLVRGLCVLNPNYPEAKGNIFGISIVDHFLEHARIYSFCNAGKPLYYIGSADFIRQKMEQRIEVVAPVFDKDLQKEIYDVMEFQLQDNTHARFIDPDNINKYIRNNKPKVRSQKKIADYLRKKYS